MARRLAIAKAFFHNPEILIMDEPVIGLDPKGIKDVRDMIKNFQKEGITIFLSSHLLHEVSDTCDSVVFLDNGKVIINDTISNITDSLRSEKITVRILNPLTQDEIGVIKDIKFKTMGCSAAIATSSMITDLAKGKTIEEAKQITRHDIADELGGLPPIKMHCSNLAADALREAIKDYERRKCQ